MNTNIKVILASTVLTALFAGQTAVAGNNNYFITKAVYSTTTESVDFRNAIFKSTEVNIESEINTEVGNR